MQKICANIIKLKEYSTAAVILQKVIKIFMNLKEEQRFFRGTITFISCEFIMFYSIQATLMMLRFSETAVCF